MLYDGSNPLHAAQARTRLEKLIGDGKAFELKERKPARSGRANRYLHVCLSYFGLQVGETVEYVKEYYYKRLCNPDIFVREKEDRFTGRVKYLRSSAELDSAEFSLSIDRFRNWSASAAGIYIPSPEEHRMLFMMESELERAKEYYING